jgi:hypothetical protein
METALWLGVEWIPHISVGLIVEEHDSETGLLTAGCR